MLLNCNASQKCTLCTTKSRAERFYCDLRRGKFEIVGISRGALAMFCSIRDHKAPLTTVPSGNTPAGRARHASAAGIGCLLAVLVLFTSSTAHAACSTAALPATGPTVNFYYWGPSAVCAAASAGTSVTSAITTLTLTFDPVLSVCGRSGYSFGGSARRGHLDPRCWWSKIPSVRPAPPLPTGPPRAVRPWPLVPRCERISVGFRPALISVASI